MAIDTFIFDIDGVISKGDLFSVEYQKFTGVNNDAMLPFFKGDFQKALTGESDLKEIIKPWLPKWKWTGTVEELLEFWFKVDQKLDVEVIDMIIGLRNKSYKMICATNQEKYRGEFLRVELKMGYLFSSMYVSAEVGVQKTNPEFFKILQQKESLDFSKTAFIDDDQKNIDSAKSLGINTHLYTNNDSLREFINKYTGYSARG